jgi:hypothetical protein
MDVVNGILAFLGTAGLWGLFIFFMIQKQGWRLAQIVSGAILGILLVSNFPSLPQAVNDGLTGIVSSFKK